jgi:N-acetylglucosaminylphosphatidylinositol deacetylase
MSFFDLENILEMQGWTKLILLILIISNFLIIFCLKFQINIITKIKSMFDIKDIKKDLSSTNTALLIIPHPEDELLYWSPTIKTLINYNIKLKILCLSNGNYDKIGHIRTEEFKQVSKYLKLEDNELIDDPDLQDNITKFWDEKVVSQKISDFLKKNNDIETILTFDEYGITKHPNHISCYNGLVYYLKNNREEIKNKGINIFLLDSFNPILQYTCFIPFLAYYFREFGYCTYNFFTSYKVMKIYDSQFNWRRKLHVVFSSYSYCNSFIKVELKDK